jgi:hypothetical protein
VTFGSLGMQEFILNWVTQVRVKRLGPFLVGALDDGAAQLCESRGIPAVSFGTFELLSHAHHHLQLTHPFSPQAL